MHLTRAAKKLVWLGVVLMAVACGDGDLGGDGGGDSTGDGGVGGDGDGGGQQCQENCPDAGNNASSCKLVDLVIAVDGSGSMSEELVAIRDDVFPAFAARLALVGDGLDNFRVGTIDACPDPANYHTRGNGGECNFDSGEVWIDSESPNMAAEFACVGAIDTNSNCTGDNDDEQPASAAAASLEPPFSTGQNAGFSRPDALLVVLTITDEDEQPTGSAQSAQQVFDRVVATKGGDVKRVVFIGIGGGSNCTGVYGDADQAVKLKNVTDLFIANERGVWQDLCVGAIEDSLDRAFEVIEQACDELPPIL